MQPLDATILPPAALFPDISSANEDALATAMWLLNASLKDLPRPPVVWCLRRTYFNLEKGTVEFMRVAYRGLSSGLFAATEGPKSAQEPPLDYGRARSTNHLHTEDRATRDKSVIAARCFYPQIVMQKSEFQRHLVY